MSPEEKDQVEKAAYSEAFWTFTALIALFIFGCWLWSHGGSSFDGGG